MVQEAGKRASVIDTHARFGSTCSIYRHLDSSTSQHNKEGDRKIVRWPTCAILLPRWQSKGGRETGGEGKLPPPQFLECPHFSMPIYMRMKTNILLRSFELCLPLAVVSGIKVALQE